MRVVALDIALTTGYAVFDKVEGAPPKLVEHGVIKAPKLTGDYPWSFFYRARNLASSIKEKTLACIDHSRSDEFRIVVEETNKSRARYSQKTLEFTHAFLLHMLDEEGYSNVKYISTTVWRSAAGVFFSKEDSKNNKRLKAIKEVALGRRSLAAAKKAAGIKGEVTKKHAAVRWANEKFGLKLIKKDDDVADAIGLGYAACQPGVRFCDGR